jgi:hypothetical protein
MINRIILVNILFLYNQKTLDPWRIWLNLCVLPENTWSMTDMVEFVCITRKHLIHDGHGWICVYYQKTLDPWRIWLNLCVLPENTGLDPWRIWLNLCVLPENTGLDPWRIWLNLCVLIVRMHVWLMCFVC